MADAPALAIASDYLKPGMAEVARVAVQFMEDGQLACSASVRDCSDPQHASYSFGCALASAVVTFVESAARKNRMDRLEIQNLVRAAFD